MIFSVIFGKSSPYQNRPYTSNNPSSKLMRLDLGRMDMEKECCYRMQYVAHEKGGHIKGSLHVPVEECYEHGMPLPAMLVLRLGEEFYRGMYGVTGSGQAWIPDLGDELGNKFGDKSKIPENAIIFSISLLGEQICLNVLGSETSEPSISSSSGPNCLRPVRCSMYMSPDHLIVLLMEKFLRRFREITAMLHALYQISNSPPDNYIIYSDSLSALKSMTALHRFSHPLSYNVLELHDWLIGKGFSVLCCCVPSQVGISSNELANNLTKSMALLGPLKPGLFERKRHELDSSNLGGYLPHLPTPAITFP
ncbi:hypothetical protein AVEN_247968-1 [Araneus ventricosus]|uniref:RNase H type-1 domain-containing protein n=1 Tax=Araneus ventricosus TaxID=182803 RepID=A0A4Y2CI40_ARAVE|nr:hypothetical protein AVEN_247968-1 [Araneus ventricosus]